MNAGEVLVGETVTVAISVDNVPDVKAIAISDLSYNRSVFTLVDADWLVDSAIANWSLWIQWKGREGGGPALGIREPVISLFSNLVSLGGGVSLFPEKAFFPTNTFGKVKKLKGREAGTD